MCFIYLVFFLILLIRVRNKFGNGYLNVVLKVKKYLNICIVV